jgi:flagellar basal-body rod protein FlgB
MDLTQIPLFAAMAKQLHWLTARHNVIAENVANANTPGYQAADLKPLDFAKVLAGETPNLQLATTDPQHLSAPTAGDTGPNSEFRRTESGHPVSLEQQMMALSQTASDFNFTTALYQKQIALIKDAIGHGS